MEGKGGGENDGRDLGAFWGGHGGETGGPLTGGRPPCDCGRSHWRGCCVQSERRSEGILG